MILLPEAEFDQPHDTMTATDRMALIFGLCASGAVVVIGLAALARWAGVI